VIPDLERSAQAYSLHRVNGTFNTLLGNPFSLVADEIVTPEGTVKHSSVDSDVDPNDSDAEYSYSSDEDFDFNVRYIYFCECFHFC